MKNINEILKAYGVEIPEDKQADFNKELAANYKTAAEFEKKASKITELEATITEKDATITEQIEKVKELDGSAEKLTALQAENETFKQAEIDRKANEAKEVADKQVEANILAAIGDKEFINDFTRRSIIADVKNEISKPENVGKGIESILNAITKDVDVFKNPQLETVEIPAPGATPGANDISEENKARALMGLPPIGQ